MHNGIYPIIEINCQQRYAMNDLKTRLEHAMMVKNYRAKTLSIEAGLNETAIRDILKGRSKNPRTDTIRKVANILNIRHEWLVDGFGEMDISHHIDLSAAQEENTSFNHVHHSKKIPIYNLTPDTNYQYLPYKNTFIHEYAEQIACPPVLFDVPQAFACYCPDNLMVPSFTRGDILFIHPHKPVRNHQSAYIETHNGEVGIAKIHYLDDLSILISYHNDEQSLKIDRREIKKVYNIVSVQFT